MQPDKGARKVFILKWLAKDKTYCKLVVQNNLVHKIVKLYIASIVVINVY